MGAVRARAGEIYSRRGSVWVVKELVHDGGSSVADRAANSNNFFWPPEVANNCGLTQEFAESGLSGLSRPASSMSRHREEQDAETGF